MYDVAIVGGGPTGVVAANLCGLHGLSAVVLERAPDVYDLPRAAVLHDDVQRILHNAGVLDAIRPATAEMGGAEFVDASWRRIIGIEIPPGLRTANGFWPLLNIRQPDVERAMRGCLQRYERVELRSGQEVTALAEHADGVALEVRDVTGGATRTLEARWVIGCDGARSGVRKSCGIGWDSLGYDCEWLVIDLELSRAVELPPLCQQICDPERPVTFVPMPGRLRRWEFQLKPGETAAAMEDPRRVWQLLAPWLSPDDGAIVRAVVYRFHATIAETFRRGRIFLAGDAAHQTPPFMGQGLCTGVRDAENLIWKLAMVERGAAAASILDSYTAERRPLAVAMVEHSTNTGKLIDAWAAMARGGPEPPNELQEYAYGGSRTLPDLSAGLLATGGGDWVGQLLPWTEVQSARGTGAFDDIVGPRWAIVSSGGLEVAIDDDTAGFLRSIDADIVTVPEPEGAILGVLLANEVVIVRPDRVVYGGAARRDLNALIARLRADLAG